MRSCALGKCGERCGRADEAEAGEAEEVATDGVEGIHRAAMLADPMCRMESFPLGKINLGRCSRRE